MLYTLLLAITVLIQDTTTVIIPASDFLEELPKGNILTTAEAQQTEWLYNNTGIVLNSETNLMTRASIPEDGNYFLYVRGGGSKGSSFRVSVNDKVTGDAFGDTTIAFKKSATSFLLKKGIANIKITRID